MKQFVVYDVTERVVVGAHGELGQAQDEAKNRNSNIAPVDKQGHKRYLTFEVDHVQESVGGWVISVWYCGNYHD